jgi:hypothetical protein
MPKPKIEATKIIAAGLHLLGGIRLFSNKNRLSLDGKATGINFYSAKLDKSVFEYMTKINF